MRVKSGRMRNYWFPRGRAEYMTKQRFRDMGLTESAIGVRDRTFGQPRSVLEAMEGGQGQGGQGSARDTNVAAVEAYEQEAREARKRMDSLTMRVCLFSSEFVPCLSLLGPASISALRRGGVFEVRRDM